MRRPVNQSRDQAGQKRRSRAASCLLWAMAAFAGLLLLTAATAGGIYAGWSSGRTAARANRTLTAQAETRAQCERIPQNLAAGNLLLAARRLEALARAIPQPDCLAALAPTATAAYLLMAASPTAAPTATDTPLPPTDAPPPPTAKPSAPPSSTPLPSPPPLEFDLNALLLEAQSDFDRRAYPEAIDTLSAIISLDADFQRDRVRLLYLQALTAQAEHLFRRGKLSEAIILTDRARAYGDVGSLNYEYFIAETYLAAQRYKTANPAEALRLLRQIVYEQGLSNYRNGLVMSELQDALRYYGDALTYQGDACGAAAQYRAALELYPSTVYINRATVSHNLQAADLACGEQRGTALSGVATPGAPVAAIGVRSG